MMTRRITLSIAAAILALILIGVLGFAATGGNATANGDVTAKPDAATADTTATIDVATTAGDTEGESAETAGSEATTAETEQESEQEAAVAGVHLYATHCASCHGDRGGGGSGGPVDDLVLTLDEVVDITADGVPRMPAFADTLTPEEIEAVSHYTLSLSEN